MSLSDKFSASRKRILLSPIGMGAVVCDRAGRQMFERFGGRRLTSKLNKIWGLGGV
jgi:hypothetical protein